MEEELITDEQKAQIVELLNHELIDSSAKKATLTNLDKFTKERAEQCLRNITQTIEMKKNAKRDKEALKIALQQEAEENPEMQQPQTQPPQNIDYKNLSKQEQQAAAKKLWEQNNGIQEKALQGKLVNEKELEAAEQERKMLEAFYDTGD